MLAASPTQRFLFLVSGRNAPATRFRMLPYVAALREIGYVCDVAYSCPEKYGAYRWLGWRLSQQLKRLTRRWHLTQARLRNYSAIIIERELFNDATYEIEAAFSKLRSRLILDIDDGIFLQHPDKMGQLFLMADHVIAGSEQIAEVVRKTNPQVTVIPTVVDLAEYPDSEIVGSGPPSPELIIGWIGTESNVPYLNLIAEPLQQFRKQFEFRLRIITGNEAALSQLKMKSLDVEFVQWSAKTAIKEMTEFTIGVMPLADEEWERYKCGCKLIQYMACGIPSIASAVGVNKEIVNHGVNGFLATTDEEWYNSFSQLFSKQALQHQFAEAGRKTVEDRFQLATQITPFLNVLLDT